jgi:hypothetical protein
VPSYFTKVRDPRRVVLSVVFIVSTTGSSTCIMAALETTPNSFDFVLGLFVLNKGPRMNSVKWLEFPILVVYECDPSA